MQSHGFNHFQTILLNLPWSQPIKQSHFVFRNVQVVQLILRVTSLTPAKNSSPMTNPSIRFTFFPVSLHVLWKIYTYAYTYQRSLAVQPATSQNMAFQPSTDFPVFGRRAAWKGGVWWLDKPRVQQPELCLLSRFCMFLHGPWMGVSFSEPLFSWFFSPKRRYNQWVKVKFFESLLLGL